MNELTLFDRFPTLFPTNFFEKDFNDIFSGIEKSFAKTTFTYPYDLYDLMKGEKKIATVIEVAVAGFKKEDCNISLKGDQLTLKLGKQNEAPQTTQDGDGITRKYLSKRIANRTAVFSWTLAQNIDTKKIGVKYEDGILKIELPIVQPNEPEEKVIEIQ